MSKDFASLDENKASFVKAVINDCGGHGFTNTQKFLEQIKDNREVIIDTLSSRFGVNNSLCSALEYGAKHDNFSLINFLLLQGAKSGADKAVWQIMISHGDDLVNAESGCGWVVEGLKGITVGSNVWNAQDALNGLLRVGGNPTIFNQDHKEYIDRMRARQKPLTTCALSGDVASQVAEDIQDKKTR